MAEDKASLLTQLTTVSPLLARLRGYRREHFTGDLVAGLIVAIMLVPQAMAYAMLAGLPPEVGLYASLVPLILYSLFGTSNSLAVGPVAMVSLLVVSGVGELAVPGSEQFIGLCLALALMVGVLQILMAVFRMGFLVNFISHPVLIGFTSAAAVVIGFSQLKHLFGIKVDSGEYPFQLIANTIAKVGDSNLTTLAIGLASCGLLLVFCNWVAPLLKKLGASDNLATTISKVGPLVTVVAAALTVYLANFHESRSVSIVGEIPGGLPPLTLPTVSLEGMRSLLPLALVITLVGYLESISVAKALASRRREKVDANRELFALGMADIGAAFTGGYPVTGGFSRSLVNFSAGARTPMASIITALLVAVSVALLTPLFFYIPQAVLAAIIVFAVIGLIDFKTPLKLWKYSRADAIALLVTFVAVLGLGIETGILIGVAATIVMLMWNMSRPHVAEVGRVGDSEHFRNITRHDVNLTDGVLAFRVDESLNFANAPFLESYLHEQISQRPEIKSVLLISSGINEIDATGIEVLETINRELNSAGVEFYLSDVKGPVLDRLRAAGFDSAFLDSHVFISAHKALCRLSQPAAETCGQSKTPFKSGLPNPTETEIHQ
ncbi:MAG: SulP family sulfate permease [Mariniblastus sp.]|jgi:SulP family sulfate permease